MVKHCSKCGGEVSVSGGSLYGGAVRKKRGGVRSRGGRVLGAATTGGRRVHYGGEDEGGRRVVHRRAGAATGGRRGAASTGAGRPRKRVGGARTTNPWVMHVKRYAREHGIDYRDAMSRARPSYRG